MESKTNHNLKVKDMDGNVIFNSDKVRLGIHEGTVAYDIKSCRFVVKWNDGSIRPMTAHFASQVEKISC